MSERSVQLLLEDILESCNRILEYTKGLSFEDFRKNYMVVDAVVRNFTIIVRLQPNFPYYLLTS